MAATELRLVVDRLHPDAVGPVERVKHGRTPLLRFETALAPNRLAALAGQLSASAALFAHHCVDGQATDLFEPLEIVEHLVYGSELVTTQRYRGKTNERLTRAMLNAALASAGIDPSQPSGVVLDPMCGRGTTLNWALTYGLDALGIEPDRPALDQHATFVETWAKRSRLPHRMQRYKKSNPDRRHAELTVGPDRQTLKDRGQTVSTFNADGGDRSLPIKASSIDVIVTDLPYGVQHRGQAQRRGEAAEASAAPDPEDDTVTLLARLAPAWSDWLRPGGAVALAWNAKRADRRSVSRALVEAGFKPVTITGGFSMSHTVDATIDRDVLVATRSI